MTQITIIKLCQHAPLLARPSRASLRHVACPGGAGGGAAEPEQGTGSPGLGHGAVHSTAGSPPPADTALTHAVQSLNCWTHSVHSLSESPGVSSGNAWAAG